MMQETTHIPVLVDETIGGLAPRPDADLIDGTLGAGGHAEAWLEATGPDGRVLGFDLDAGALEIARERLARFGERAAFAHASYASMGDIAPERGFERVDAVLLDVGFSSMQIDDPARGFAFSADGPLDMRFDRSQPTSAADLVNRLGRDELADLIYEYGEERHSRCIARAIVEARPIDRTGRLAEVVAGAVPRSSERIHPATRTFQALRIAVNDELGAIERALPQAVDLLRPGGRLAVISFHSLEDRIVKHFIREAASDCICPPDLPMCACNHEPTLQAINRKPITATDDEVNANPRARSAKLRIAERL